MTGDVQPPREPGSAAGARAVRSGEAATSLRYSLMDLARTRDDVISLGRGDPDLHTAASIIEGGLEGFVAASGGDPRDLTDVRGLSALRAGVARRYQVEKGVPVDPDTEVLITNGGQEGLFLAMMALVTPGDRVACPDPRYTSYDQAIGAAGGEIVSLPTGGDLPFELSASALREHAGDARLLVFVNPSNPTGALVSPDGVRALSAAARDLDLVVLSDEIYEDVVFDGRPFHSMLACEGAREHTVVLSGFSKAYAMTGFRVGYLVGDATFIEACAALKATTSGPCPPLSQACALAALELDDDPRPGQRAVYEARRTALLDAFHRIGLPHGPHGGGLFVWADVSHTGMDAKTFCYRLLDEAGVLMFPGASFGARWQSWVRVSLLAPEDQIREAMARLDVFMRGLVP